MLTEHLETHEPDVLALTEVTGNLKQCKALRAWARVRGYNAVFLSGQGGSKAHGDVISNANGIALLARKKTVTIRRSVRVAERVLGVTLRCAGEGTDRAIVVIHGFHGESRAVDPPPRRSFAAQLLAIKEWASKQGGALCVGDWNRVPCRFWRTSETFSMGRDDERVRQLSGWRCNCCITADEIPTYPAVVGGDASSNNAVGWTRFAPPSKEEKKEGILWAHPTARLDYAVALGNERGCWSWVEDVPLELESGARASDHWLVAVRRLPVLSKTRGTPRDVGVPLRASHPLAAETATGIDDAWNTAHLDALVGHEARKASAAGNSALGEVVVPTLVKVGRDVHEDVKRQQKSTLAHAAGANGGIECPKGRYNCWKARLTLALSLRADHKHPLSASDCLCKRGAALFHRGTGLAKLIEDSGSLSVRDAWVPVVRRCRREVTRAGVARRRVLRREDADLVEAAREMNKCAEDALSRFQRAWRAIRKERGGEPLDTLCVEDNPDCEHVPSSDSRFLGLAGDIGDKFVESMKSNPAVLPAFEAFCDLFLQPFAELKGTDGADWVLEKELTWELFLEVLFSIPKGKAVGAGGFSVELLIAAGESAWRTFYDALMADVRGGNLAAHWRKVVYALLPKPAPSRREVVSENREIALMPQDMKLLLHMIRRVSYQRIVGRVIKVQGGWLPGFGPTDPGLAAALLIQQAERTGMPLWLLFIDLATMFPRCDRGVIRAVELLHGLPEQVVKLALLIYGTEDDPDGCVECQYETAAGLGRGFKNWMGALMGCPLSPDKAKLLLNSILVAINAVVKGVRLWGYSRDAVNGTFRQLCQLGYADDVCSAFSNVEDLRKAWAIWCVWEAAAGCKLGFKLKLKTVVTGVKYAADGKPVDPGDPKLPRPDGGFVPFARFDEAYKHLGNWRCVCGDEKSSWRKLKVKFMAAIERIGRMRHPTMREFIMVSDALLGGLAGYYLQTMYITWQEAEEVESAWRAVFRKKFRREVSIARSAPRVLFYEKPAKGRQGRTHIWAVGLAALVSCFGKAVSDVDDTSQRAAARSALALSMERWGCCSDPNKWSWVHLTEELERSLRHAHVRHLGDAWLLATALLESTEDAAGARLEELDGATVEARNFGRLQRRLRTHGRWAASPELALCDPLHGDALHFERPWSALLFEPVASGGLGAPPQRALLNAGVKALAHVCRHATMGEGLTQERHPPMKPSNPYKWSSFKHACSRNARLRACAWAERAWDDTIKWLEAHGVQPVMPTRVAPADGGLGSQRQLDGDMSGKRCGVQEVSVDDVELHKLASELRFYAHLVFDAQGVPSKDGAALKRSDLPAHLQQDDQPSLTQKALGKNDWYAKLASCFKGLVPEKAKEWIHGSYDRGEAAIGPFYVRAFDETVETSGGEATWWRRKEARHEKVVPVEERGQIGCAASGDDFAVGEDGYAIGWRDEALRLHGLIRFDECGYACDSEDVPLLTEEMLGELPPALQLEARAPLMLRGGKTKLLIVNEWPPIKRTATHINLAVQRKNHGQMAIWQARLRFTSAYSLDGSWGDVPVPRQPGGRASKERRTARSACRHDGLVIGGRMDELIGEDNYLAELAAQLDAGNNAQAGERTLIVFDATSPALAARRFERVCSRRKQEYYGDQWLGTLCGSLSALEVVCQIWQTSHVGAPINEWPDVAADAALRDDEVSQVPVCARGHASLRPSRPNRGLHAWARGWGKELVLRRLRSCCVQTVFAAEDDVQIAPLPEWAELLRRAVRSQRCCMGDPKKHVGRFVSKACADAGCPFGCVAADGIPVAFTWLHAATKCSHPPIVAEREVHLEAMSALQSTFDGLADVPHSALLWTTQCLQAGIPRLRAGRSWVSLVTGDIDPFYEERLRGLVSGYMRGSGEPQVDQHAEVRDALHAATVAGLAVQRVAIQESAEAEEAILAHARGLHMLRPMVSAWSSYVRRNGPARVASLRCVRVASRRAESLVKRLLEHRNTRVAGSEVVMRRLRQATARMIELAYDADSQARDGAAHLWLMANAVRTWRAQAGARRVNDESMRRLRHATARLTELASDAHPQAGDEAARLWLMAGAIRSWRTQAATRRVIEGYREEWRWMHVASLDHEVSAIASVALEENMQVRPVTQIRNGAHLVSCWLTACRARMRFETCGGLEGLQKLTQTRAVQARREALLARKRREAAMRNAMVNWRKKGSLSGAPLNPVQNRVRLDLSVSIEEAEAKRARVEQQEAVDRGDISIGDGLYKVERLLAVRRPGGSGRRLDVLVQWAGRWDAEWKSISTLWPASLRAEARAMEATLFGDSAAWNVANKQGQRGSSRFKCDATTDEILPGEGIDGAAEALGSAAERRAERLANAEAQVQRVRGRIASEASKLRVLESDSDEEEVASCTALNQSRGAAIHAELITLCARGLPEKVRKSIIRHVIHATEMEDHSGEDDGAGVFGYDVHKAAWRVAERALAEARELMHGGRRARRRAELEKEARSGSTILDEAAMSHVVRRGREAAASRTRRRGLLWLDADGDARASDDDEEEAAHGTRRTRQGCLQPSATSIGDLPSAGSEETERTEVPREATWDDVLYGGGVAGGAASRGPAPPTRTRRRTQIWVDADGDARASDDDEAAAARRAAECRPRYERDMRDVNMEEEAELLRLDHG